MAVIRGAGSTPFKKCTCTSKAKCPHGWTVRYREGTSNKSRTFRDDIGADGKVRYGSGKKKAEDFALQRERNERAGEHTFTEASKSALLFTEYAQAWVDRHKNEGTRRTLTTALNRVLPDLGSMTLAQVARDREFAQGLIDDAPASYTRKIRQVLVSPCNEAVKAGRITSHRLNGLDMDAENVRADFEVIEREKLEAFAGNLEEFGLLAWLGLLAGLRLGESLGVHIGDFRNNGTVLRVTRQRLTNGKLAPMKARRHGDYRDIPVPAFLWRKVQESPDGYLLPGYTRTPVRRRLVAASKAAGLPEKFTPHWLRHQYVSDLLGNGIEISTVARYVGHRDINVTYKVYGHLIPSASDRTRDVLDAIW